LQEKNKFDKSRKSPGNDCAFPDPDLCAHAYLIVSILLSQATRMRKQLFKREKGKGEDTKILNNSLHILLEQKDNLKQKVFFSKNLV
jgi:hypothetical protein